MYCYDRQNAARKDLPEPYIQTHGTDRMLDKRLEPSWKQKNELLVYELNKTV